MYLKEVFNGGLKDAFVSTSLVLKCLDENKTGCSWYHWVDIKTTKYDQAEVRKFGVVEETYL
jgi:hypothetical protein